MSEPASQPERDDLPRTEIEGSAYLEPYREAVARYGASFKALLWNSQEYQLARFAAIADTVDLTGRCVADLGCGRADLLAWLNETGVEYGKYVGVEALAELADDCRTRIAEHDWPEAEIVGADFVSDRSLFDALVRHQRADTLIFSGSLNTMKEELAREIVRRAWGAARRVPGGAVVFNFLSSRCSHCDDPKGPAHRFDPVAMLDFALSLTPIAVLRKDYLGGHDATIALLTEPPADSPARGE